MYVKSMYSLGNEICQKKARLVRLRNLARSLDGQILAFEVRRETLSGEITELEEEIKNGDVVNDID